MNTPRIDKKKDWKLTAVTVTGQRIAYYFDTEADADAAAIILMAHCRDMADAIVSPRV